MFCAVDHLSEDLRRFVAEPESVALPFTFATDDLGAAIIQIAAGKAPVDWVQQSAASDKVSIGDLQSAAQRFVAKVMLEVGADLFTVLGVSSSSEPAAFRDNYRRLMAMVHPDARPTGFPTDAAIRVNHAYAVLSDAEQLERYKVERAALRACTIALPPIAAGGRSQHASQAIRESGFSGRIGALLFRARERGLLLWLALLLLVPVGGAFYFTLSETPHVRLVEAGSKLGASQVGAALAPSVSSALTAPVAPVSRVNKSANDSGENTQNSGIRGWPLQPSLRPNAPTASQTAPMPALAFETSLSMSKLATLVQPASNVPSPPDSVSPILSSIKAPGSLAPTPSLSATQTRQTLNTAVEIVNPALATKSAPAAVARSEPVMVDKQPSLSLNNAQAAMVAQETRAPISTAAGAPVTHRLRSVDVEDVLLRFSNAYEAGSLSGFDQVLAPGMPGRSQLLTDYGRVFQITRNRSIRFIQLKHAAAGERMATRGYAVVTTTDQDNRVSKQRVYLEFEIGIDQNVPRIERIANYVVN